MSPPRYHLAHRFGFVGSFFRIIFAGDNSEFRLTCVVASFDVLEHPPAQQISNHPKRSRPFEESAMRQGPPTKIFVYVRRKGLGRPGCQVGTDGMGARALRATGKSRGAGSLHDKYSTS
jgi:hypothetical protein